MYKFEITPFEEVGNIRLNDSRDYVRKLYPDYTEFRKSKFSKNTTDDFKSFHVFYDKDNKIEAVELFDDVELMLKGNNIFSMSYSELLQLVKKNSFSYKEDESGINIESEGVSVYAPDKSKIETVLIYRKGYFS